MNKNEEFILDHLLVNGARNWKQLTESTDLSYDILHKTLEEMWFKKWINVEYHTLDNLLRRNFPTVGINTLFTLTSWKRIQLQFFVI